MRGGRDGVITASSQHHLPMSIADHIKRFSPQMTLDLPAAPPPPPVCPRERPTTEMLVSAALENVCVRIFIEDRLATWTREKVERNPPCCIVYEHGDVVGSLDDVPMMLRYAQKRPGLGPALGLRALRPDEEVLAFTIGLRWGPTHPSRFRYEQRMALKCLLARDDRVAVRSAVRRSQRTFLAWAEARPGLAARIAETTGLSLLDFWRAVRGPRRRNP